MSYFAEKKSEFSMMEIDLEQTYVAETIALDRSFMTCFAESRSGAKVLIKIQLTLTDLPFFPDVYNLAFGPVIDNRIDDEARVSHENLKKLLSTVALFSVLYLEKHPDVSIGIDGSNDARAYLYHRIFQTNRRSLSLHFKTIGIDFYARLMRNGRIETDKGGVLLFKPKPEPFDYQRNSSDLYRYYIFQAKK